MSLRVSKEEALAILEHMKVPHEPKSKVTEGNIHNKLRKALDMSQRAVVLNGSNVNPDTLEPWDEPSATRSPLKAYFGELSLQEGSDRFWNEMATGRQAEIYVNSLQDARQTLVHLSIWSQDEKLSMIKEVEGRYHIVLHVRPFHLEWYRIVSLSAGYWVLRNH